MNAEEQIKTLTESTQETVDEITEMINNVSKLVMINQGQLSEVKERITRTTKLALAIVQCLDEKTQKQVSKRLADLMQTQKASDQQVAEWEAQEKKGIETPLSKAKKVAEQSKENQKARENPNLN